jgi:hypothetical protein
MGGHCSRSRQAHSLTLQLRLMFRGERFGLRGRRALVQRSRPPVASWSRESDQLPASAAVPAARSRPDGCGGGAWCRSARAGCGRCWRGVGGRRADDRGGWTGRVCRPLGPACRAQPHGCTLGTGGPARARAAALGGVAPTALAFLAGWRRHRSRRDRPARRRHCVRDRDEDAHLPVRACRTGGGDLALADVAAAAVVPARRHAGCVPGARPRA